MAEKEDTIAEGFSATDNKIDRIRAILVGAQMQKVERRIEAIENRVEQEIAKARENATRLGALENAFERELTELSKRYQKTLMAYEDLARSVNAAVENIHHEFSNQIASLNARFLAQSSEFRTQLNLHEIHLHTSLQGMRATLVKLLVSELHQDKIRNVAYRQAEKRGFAEGDPEQDWREAVAEIEREVSNKFAGIDSNISAADSGE